jgi:hypothetical protein
LCFQHVNFLKLDVWEQLFWTNLDWENSFKHGLVKWWTSHLFWHLFWPHVWDMSSDPRSLGKFATSNWVSGGSLQNLGWTLSEHEVFQVAYVMITLQSWRFSLNAKPEILLYRSQ